MSSKNDLRSMADLLRNGATLTALSCPACNSPLFRLKNEDLFCGSCKKKVIVVKEGLSHREGNDIYDFISVESTLLLKIREINNLMKSEDDIDHLLKLSNLISVLLESFYKIKKIQKEKP
jgi:uncharacterized Zn finger protein (UPF0148 family)